MKKIFLIAFIVTFMLSCKKEINPDTAGSAFISNILKGLKDSLSDNDFANINIDKSIITKIDGGKWFLRIPFKGKEISKDFTILQTGNSGKIERGFIINVSRNAIEKGKEYEFNGFIKKSSLDRKAIWSSALANGIITHNHPAIFANRSLVVPIPKDTTIILVTDDGPSISYSDWISISGIFNTSGYFGADGGYLYAGYYNYSGSAGQTQIEGLYPTPSEGIYPIRTAEPYPAIVPNYENIIETDPLFVDQEIVENLAPVDVTKFIKCFSNIPDDGSTCSIEILSDIPVDSDPNKLFNWQTESPGHTFIQIRKTNGNLSVMQNIGFYPSEGWKTILTTAPVPGKLVDNGEHEYNASLKMVLTPEQLKKTLDEIIYLSGFVKYDIDDFNCTDFALDVFNVTRISNELVIPRYDIPGGTAPNGSNTPQGLYNELKTMQQQGIESANITIPGFKGYVASSDGPCN